MAVSYARHAAREAEPKDYDVSTSSDGDRDLLRATYNRIGNITDGVSFYSDKFLLCNPIISIVFS